MSCAAKQDLEICQGKTFSKVLRWGAQPIVYKPITGITKAAPARITCVGHGIPNGWSVAVVSVQGMKQINANNDPPKPVDYHRATVVDGDTIELNTVNASGFSQYTSGGYVQFYTPVDMTGMTARMTIKDKIGGTALETLTTDNGKLVIDNTAKTIRIVLSAAATAGYTWKKGVYDLELLGADGVTVTALMYGSVSVTKEVTA